MDVKIGIICSALLLAAATASPAVLAGDSFALGTRAFKQGDYTGALAQFEREQRAGNESANLKYNLGVTLYKLQRYAAAAEYFRQLRADPQWHDLAEFQLGLVAEKRGRPERAAAHYRALSGSSSARLRQLGAARLAALAPAAPQPPVVPEPSPWLGVASLALGNDNNAYALQNDLLQDSSVGQDSFSELFVWGQYQLQGDAVDGWRLHGFGYGRRYTDLSDLDLDSYRLGLSRDLQWDGWQVELGGAGELVSLGGQRVSSEIGGVGRLRRDIGDAELTLAYLPSHFSGSGSYDYLDGWRHRFDAKWEQPLGLFKLDALYRLELNDRADLESGTSGRYSYSPTRQTLGVALEWPLLGGWSLTAGADYRHSRYAGINSLIDSDGVQKQHQRQAQRWRGWLQAELRLLPRLALAGKLTWTDNAENFDIYTYDKGEASLSARYSF
ncbi:tetratricopeptide repeat protein [Microbulbifer sp. SAOS-129_SWC]|uniref:tetratricopeptide repeat protein n=1 Tax=Microbulbifer sp. SAOS-129_SWC TaxID=3145235 RepID=UPI003216260F